MVDSNVRMPAAETPSLPPSCRAESGLQLVAQKRAAAMLPHAISIE